MCKSTVPRGVPIVCVIQEQEHNAVSCIFLENANVLFDCIRGVRAYIGLSASDQDTLDGKRTNSWPLKQ